MLREMVAVRVPFGLSVMQRDQEHFSERIFLFIGGAISGGMERSGHCTQVTAHRGNRFV